MKLSNYFLPLLKENPKDAQIVSHRLMLRAGMIQQSSSGIYSWLPLGNKVMKKIENIVRNEQKRSGALEILMPTIQPSEIWKESGRYDDYGQEMLRIRDRHDREMLYGPTNEEQVTDIIRTHIKSYKNLPLNLFHIQWKFRDEVRPRFGVMRGREFLMKDAYSFDISEKEARTSYNKMFISYLKIFNKLGLTAIPMEAETGPIGGDMSHEFIILADTGESSVYFDKKWLNKNLITDVSYEDDLSKLVKEFTSIYAKTDDMYNEKECPIDKDDLLIKRGIEVGHIFNFGTKYSIPMKAEIIDSNGKLLPIHMGSYGIGVSRLVGAIIESSHDDKGIIWPKSVSPFDLVIINLKPNDIKCSKICEDIYQYFTNAGYDILIDDRSESPGAKLSSMELIGIPWQVIVGPRGLEKNIVELKNRNTTKTQNFTVDSIKNKLVELMI